MLIIVEGVDNCGKDFVISELKKRFVKGTITEMHCTRPQGKTPEEQARFQDKEFMRIAKMILNADTENNTVILNRSWLGEYVYGQLYRGRDAYSIKKMIATVESTLCSVWDSTYVICLLPDCPEFIVKHDDNKSLSDNNIKKIAEEIDLFDQATLLSSFKSKVITVSKNDSYRDINDIMQDITEMFDEQ